jgi:hypothetical protein
VLFKLFVKNVVFAILYIKNDARQAEYQCETERRLPRRQRLAAERVGAKQRPRNNTDHNRFNYRFVVVSI